MILFLWEFFYDGRELAALALEGEIGIGVGVSLGEDRAAGVGRREEKMWRLERRGS